MAGYLSFTFLLACLLQTGQSAYTTVRPAVLGLTLERSPDARTFRVVRRARGKVEVLASGERAACEALMVELLEKKHGTGNLNVPFMTLGGRQGWADEKILAGWRIQANVITGHHRLLDPRDRRRAWGSWQGCCVVLEKQRLRLGLAPASDKLVLLLHGLGRSRHSWARMKATLAAHGHEVFDVGYPSTRRSIDEHTAQVSRLLDRAEGAREVSFVTHSLGGIVVRQLLAKKRPWQQRIRAKRVVMLGPPNRGSVIAKKVRRSSAVRLVLGASISQLTAAQVAKIPAPPIPFAVIAGGKGDGSGYNPLLDGDDDGVVTVANTKLDGMADFRLLRCLHTSLMNHDRALALVRDFLEKGSFGTR